MITWLRLVTHGSEYKLTRCKYEYRLPAAAKLITVMRNTCVKSTENETEIYPLRINLHGHHENLNLNYVVFDVHFVQVCMSISAQFSPNCGLRYGPSSN